MPEGNRRNLHSGRDEIEPSVHGAGHEAGRRAGTENVLLPWRSVQHASGAEVGRMTQVKICVTGSGRGSEGFSGEVTLNGHPTERLPNTLNVNFVEESVRRSLRRFPGCRLDRLGMPCRISDPFTRPGRQWGAAGRMGAVRFSLGGLRHGRGWRSSGGAERLCIS